MLSSARFAFVISNRRREETGTALNVRQHTAGWANMQYDTRKVDVTPTHTVTNLGKTYWVIILSTRFQVGEEYALCQNVDREEEYYNIRTADLVEIENGR